LTINDCEGKLRNIFIEFCLHDLILLIQQQNSDPLR
ncbi:uncharacterized protein METZ01_LOCUS44162, partial [marine metagenome]